MKLQTTRLFISYISEGDADFISELLNTSGWLKFIGDRHVNSSSEAHAYIKEIFRNPDVDYRIVRLKESNETIGLITFIKREYLEHPDIGFAFLPKFQKNGYAEEATLSVLHQLASESKFSTVLAVTVPSNFKSIKLLNKLGLVYCYNMEINKENLNVYVAPADRILIHGLCKAFYRLFDNTSGREVRLSLLESMCVPEIKIYKRQKEGYTVTNLLDFIRTRQKLLTDGSLVDFCEKEVSSETSIKGNVAQRSSEYVKIGRRQGDSFSQSGSKLFQFIKNNDAWEICSIVWEDAELE